MLGSITIYASVVFIPFKKFNKYNIKLFIIDLNKLLTQKNGEDVLKYLGDIVYFYDSLLEFSLENNDARTVFITYFRSNLLLTLFSEHAFLFEKTLEFGFKKIKTTPLEKLRHINQFTNNLFVLSLNNQKSFLNGYLDEHIYPNSSFYLDELFVKHPEIDHSHFLFEEISFNGLGIDGKISFIKLAGHYFELIHRANMAHNQEGYEKKLDYNDDLIFAFFENIKRFFESEFEQENRNLLLKALSSIGWNYSWGVRTKDKSKKLREKTGIFLYDVFESIISRFKPENDDIFRLNLIGLYRDYLETQRTWSINTLKFLSIKIQKFIAPTHLRLR